MKIAIASGKGGTGKTLLSTNLAAWLALSQPVLLVDLDVEEPNDSIFINGKEESVTSFYTMVPEWKPRQCTLCGLCSEVCKFHAVIQLGDRIAVFDDLCHSCYACSELCPTGALPMRKFKSGEVRSLSSGNLRFVESRLEVGREQPVPLIRYTHELVDSRYSDVVIQIFDCPPGTSCPVVAAVGRADLVILVTEPTPFGLNDLKLAVDTMRILGKRCGVVINRQGVGNDSVIEYCKQERLPVIAGISFNRDIAGYYARGELAFDKIGTVAEALRQIMEFALTPVNDGI